MLRVKIHPCAPLVSAVLLAEEELVRHLHPPVKKLEKEFTLVNRFGLHVRPAAMLARTANHFHFRHSCREGRTRSGWQKRDGPNLAGRWSRSEAAHPD